MSSSAVALVSGGERQSRAQGLRLPGCSEEAQNWWDPRWPHVSLLLPWGLLQVTCRAPWHGQGPLCSPGTEAEVPAVLSLCFVAAGSDPGAEAKEKSATICPHEWVAKLSPELKTGIRDCPDRAEPLATVLEVSVPVTPGGVSDPCSKGGYSYRDLSGVGTPGNFGCLVQLEPSQTLPSLQAGLGTAAMACKSCVTVSGWSHVRVSLFGGGKKEF